MKDLLDVIDAPEVGSVVMNRRLGEFEFFLELTQLTFVELKIDTRADEVLFAFREQRLK